MVAVHLPTDRGIVVVKSSASGKTVVVCQGVDEAGNPISPYAAHYNCLALEVHEGVSLVRRGRNQHTTQIVEVFSQERGEVHLRPINSDRYPPLDV